MLNNVNITIIVYRTWWHFHVGKMLSTNQGVQSQMLQELERRE